MTEATKKGSCWIVKGKVQRAGVWLDASFTAHAPDVEAMSRQEFEAFAIRTLPSVTVDIDWQEHMKR